MRVQRLLERIGNLGEDPTRQGQDEKSVLFASILAYLVRILNTREGSVPIDPAFGVPHYTSMAARFSTEAVGTIREMEAAVRGTIEKYEPRLENVQVRMMDKAEFDITMTMSLIADMKMDAESVPVSFKVTVTPSGRVEVYA
jgi:type VI secretion system protein